MFAVPAVPAVPWGCLQDGIVARKDSWSEFRVRRLVADADKKFNECWDILAMFKDVRGDARLWDFQQILFEALFRLSRAHHGIAAHRNDLIARKRTLSPSWFVRRQRVLAGYQDTLETAIAVGRSIGDAFAWFFYQNDRALLDRHAEQPPPTVLPGAVGGIAELQFVRGVRVIADKFVLFHGITTLVRIGDFSLIEMEPLRVLALGELKAGRPQGDQLTVEATMIMAERLKTVPTLPTMMRGVQSRQSTRSLTECPHVTALGAHGNWNA